ncbi:hypothetical protein [Rhodococcus erythropolis]|nr:hypothetical protein [Rhodococcus erythropolis]
MPDVPLPSKLTPYPPGVPVVAPGEHLDTEVVDYLQPRTARR